MKTVDLSDYRLPLLRRLGNDFGLNGTKQELVLALTRHLDENKTTYASNPKYSRYYSHEAVHLVGPIKPLRKRHCAVVTIHVLIIAIEAAGLAYNVRRASTTAVPTIDHDYKPIIRGMASGARVQAMFEALEPCIIWSITSWIVPLISAYLYNTIFDASAEFLERPYPINAFAFSTVKFVLAHVAYRQPASNETSDQACQFFCGRVWSWNLYSHSTFRVVRNSVPGGYDGLLLGAFVGILVSIYDTIRESQRAWMLRTAGGKGVVSFVRPQDTGSAP